MPSDGDETAAEDSPIVTSSSSTSQALEKFTLPTTGETATDILALTAEEEDGSSELDDHSAEDVNGVPSDQDDEAWSDYDLLPDAEHEN